MHLSVYEPLEVHDLRRRLGAGPGHADCLGGEPRLDLHSWQLLKGVVLSTLLGVGSELALSGDSDLVQAVRQSTQQSAGRAGDQLVARNLNVQPTITIRPGASVRLVVHRDLVMQPWERR